MDSDWCCSCEVDPNSDEEAFQSCQQSLPGHGLAPAYFHPIRNLILDNPWDVAHPGSMLVHSEEVDSVSGWDQILVVVLAVALSHWQETAAEMTAALDPIRNGSEPFWSSRWVQNRDWLLRQMVEDSAAVQNMDCAD